MSRVSLYELSLNPLEPPPYYKREVLVLKIVSCLQDSRVCLISYLLTSFFVAVHRLVTSLWRPLMLLVPRLVSTLCSTPPNKTDGRDGRSTILKGLRRLVEVSNTQGVVLAQKYHFKSIYLSISGSVLMSLPLLIGGFSGSCHAFPLDE